MFNNIRRIRYHSNHINIRLILIFVQFRPPLGGGGGYLVFEDQRRRHKKGPCIQIAPGGYLPDFTVQMLDQFIMTPPPPSMSNRLAGLLNICTAEH